MPNWELYSTQGRNATSEPVVSLHRTGSLALNKAAYEALGQPKAVQLLFDREEQIAGLRPVEPGAPDSYVVRKQDRSSTYLVAGKTFTTYYKIDIGATRRYNAQMYYDVLGVDLKDERSSSPSGKRAARSS